MKNVSWSALLAAALTLVALVLVALDVNDEALIIALSSITFALLSHRDA